MIINELDGILSLLNKMEMEVEKETVTGGAQMTWYLIMQDLNTYATKSFRIVLKKELKTC